MSKNKPKELPKVPPMKLKTTYIAPTNPNFNDTIPRSEKARKAL